LPLKSLRNGDGEVRELTDGEVRLFRPLADVNPKLSQALALLTWMVGVNSAFVLAIFTKLFLR